MDIGTVVGLLVGLLAIVLTMGTAVEARSFLDPLSAALVLGGTIAATLVNFPLDQCLRAMRSMREVFFDGRESPAHITSLLVALSEKSRRQGVLALENDLEELPLELMRRAVQRVVDGASPAVLREQMELELDTLEENMDQSRQVFEALAGYAPAFGMMGTVMGLIKMLTTLKDPSSLGPAMALALVTTFYGVVLANVLFLPIAGKLTTRANHELLLGHLVTEGVVAISAGEHPAVVRSILQACGGELVQEQQQEGSYESTTAAKAGAP